MARGKTLLTIICCVSVTLSGGLCRSAPCPVQRADQQVVLNCTHAGLKSPLETWPGEVTHVDLSYNNISSLRGVIPLGEGGGVRQLDLSHNLLHTLDVGVSALGELTGLRGLDLSHNQLTLVHPRSLAALTSMVSLDLSYNRLGSTGAIPADTFQGLEGLQWMDLSHNQLSALTNDTFSGLWQLTWLSVRNNGLERLEAGALSGLGGLLVLDLSHNQLVMASTALPAGVFSPLFALRDLRLHHNDGRQQGGYPDQVFNHLPSLRYLALDTFSNPEFGQDFAALSQLRTLDLTENCKIIRLSNQSFRGFHFSPLRELSIKGCVNLWTIETCTFCHLPNLTTLKVTWARFLRANVGFRALYGLQGQTMDTIDMSRNGFWGPETFIVDKESAYYLRNICVSTLRLHNSHLQRFEAGSLSKEHSLFIKCIEHFDISYNNLHGDFFELLRINIFSHRLQTIELQMQQRFSVLDSVCTLSDRCTDHHVGVIPRGLKSATIPVAPTLVLFNMSAIFSHLTPLPPNLMFSHAHSLKALDLSYSGMASCRSTFYGLEHLETLNLNFNYCYDISDTLLDYLPSLKHLGLSNFGATTEFYSRHGQRFFQHLLDLKELDLSLNRLLRMPEDTLQAQAQLTHLKLSSNRFQYVPVRLGHHDNLTLLDLSYNMLPTLTVQERAAMDHLASQHEFRLQLVGNPLTCTCDNLDMVQWLEHTSVSLDGEGAEGNYSCTLETGEMTDTHRVLAAMLPHWRNCVGFKMFGVALSLFLTQLLLLVLSYVIRTHWTRLRYVWKTLRPNQLPHRLRDFARDAYLVYADTDRDVMWACLTLPSLLRQHRPLRLLLRNAEELPCVPRAENIVQQIDMSWKTVLLVTQDFSRDPWACSFAVRQATRCISDLTPLRVIVVFLEDPRLLDPMPPLRVLLPLLPASHVLHVHPLAPTHHPAWRALADAIVEE